MFRPHRADLFRPGYGNLVADVEEEKNVTPRSSIPYAAIPFRHLGSTFAAFVLRNSERSKKFRKPRVLSECNHVIIINRPIIDVLNRVSCDCVAALLENYRRGDARNYSFRCKV